MWQVMCTARRPDSVRGKTGSHGPAYAQRHLGVVDLHALEEENALAKSVMATRIFFITVKTKALAAFHSPLRERLGCPRQAA